jgi:hypothetical protein
MAVNGHDLILNFPLLDGHTHEEIDSLIRNTTQYLLNNDTDSNEP